MWAATHSLGLVLSAEIEAERKAFAHLGHIEGVLLAAEHLSGVILWIAWAC